MPIGLCFVHSFSLYKVFKLHYFSLDFLFAGSLTHTIKTGTVLSFSCATMIFSPHAMRIKKPENSPL